MLCLTVLLLGSGRADAYSNGMVVLVYHHVADPVDGDVTVTPGAFAAQIEALKKAGCTLLSLDQAVQYLTGAMPFAPQHPVLITFDDGYESNYTLAFPVLKRLSVPAVIYVVTSRLGRKPQFLRYMSGEQMGEMAASGLISFGSHTHDLHDQLKTEYMKAAQEGKEQQFLGQLRDDLAMSRAVIASWTGQVPTTLAWPYGSFNARMTRVARDLGFGVHATSVPGINEVGTDPAWVKRIPVTRRDTAASILRRVGIR